MKTTVIIPTYNRATFLPFAINSLLAQSGDVDLDILIVDDGSTDATAKTVADMEKIHPAIRYVWRQNGGVACARNTGLDNLLPETDIVTFLDSDDILAPGRFRADLTCLAKDPALDLTYGRMILTEEIDYAGLSIPKMAKQLNLRGIHLTSALIRRRVFDHIGRFDEGFEQAEDTDLLLRIFESGSNFQQTETISHFYVRHSDNMTNDANKSRRFFAQAVMASIRRRKLDPSLKLRTPDFKLAPVPTELDA